jgi:triacylglycerol lipase
MPIAYHSNCCPVMAREMAMLTLHAYQLYYDNKSQTMIHDKISVEAGEYRVITLFRAKVLPLSRYKVLGFIATRDDVAYVIFRGTESISEWVGDTRFIQVSFLKGWGKVHKGFRQIYRSCSSQILETLANIEPGINRLYVSGHSLGAAISTLACAEISESTRFNSPVHYTFASPRVGNLAFAQKFEQTITHSFRIMNTEDLVITEPKAAMVGKICQFSHVGIPFAFTHHGGSLSNNHLLESYMLHI